MIPNISFALSVDSFVLDVENSHFMDFSKKNEGGRLVLLRITVSEYCYFVHY